jgi:hypothetical protein
MENRAAVFTSRPQDVEVYRDGGWWPGFLLGWRHDDRGSCQVWVRLTVAGSETTTWTELDALRLPSAVTAPAAAAAWAGPGPDGEYPTVAAGPLVDPSATCELARVGDAATGELRTRPPAVAATVAPRPAPAEDHILAWRSATAGAAGAPGRHRAPAASGRHRAADTDVFPAFIDEAPGVRQAEPWSAPAPGTAWVEPDVDRLTRRLQLKPVAAAGARRPAVPQDRRSGVR